MARPCVPDGLTAQPWQTYAVWWAGQRRHVYWAVDPGLGKTIAAALVTNETVWNRTQTDNRPKPVVHYVCPPSLTANVAEKMERWLTPDAPRPLVIADSQLAKVTPPSRNAPSLLFVDEAHRFMHEKTGRSQILFDYARGFSRVIFMSGTPMPNSRPRELWPILVNFAPDVFGANFFRFAKQFCGAERTHWGWKFDGATNIPEFRSRITGSFMLRIRKSEVADELPEKLEELLTIGDMPPVVSRLEKRVLEHFTAEDLIEGKVAVAAGAEGAMHLSTYLKHLGAYKVRYIVPYIEQVLAATKERLLVFARHVDAVHDLAKALDGYRPLVITGAVPAKRRHDLVTAWAASGGRLMIANIEAAGIGLDIQVADRVVLVEYTWRDGDNQQASDRAHRFGRVGAVRVQYVVLKDSLDAKRMTVLLDKRANAV